MNVHTFTLKSGREVTVEWESDAEWNLWYISEPLEIEDPDGDEIGQAIQEFVAERRHYGDW